jgi:NADH:ubiquinone oxidoreductase subunit E
MTDPKAAAVTVVLREQPPSVDRPPNILRTLLAVEQEVGYVPMEAVASIATTLGVTEADVVGVLSYYPDLHRRPRARHVLRLCTGEACVANGSLRLLTELNQQLDMEPGGTSADGQFTLERVYCLGNCGVGPTVMVDDQMYGRVTSTELPQILGGAAGTR